MNAFICIIIEFRNYKLVVKVANNYMKGIIKNIILSFKLLAKNYYYFFNN